MCPSPAHAFRTLWTDGSTALVANLHARLDRTQTMGADLPVTLSDAAQRPNCYLCRPSTAYIDYGIEETRHFTRMPLLRAALTGLLGSAAPLLRASGLDHQAQINNWLLATNPPPPPGIRAAMHDLARRHPDRVIVLRSLNDATDAPLLAELQAAGFALLPARQVWIWHPGPGPIPRDRRRDAALLADGRFTLLPGAAFTQAQFATAAALYAQLYLQKYTPLNPHYTPAFLRGMAQTGLMRLTGLRAGDQLLGVIGTVALGGMLTAPVVGYRTDLPQSLGLYRRLLALAMAEAEAARIPFHMSAGAASFKRNRGARPAIEYTAALVSHLPRRNRIATAALASLLTRIGVPVMRRYGL
ncbi:GNAT family N-acetyltransferase [Pseudorhodobacter sp. MZDSW-24AT]|uniref:GNAT family N-acetyltransferase n=1 Tax=Pseudorhodobacter sp. MZDSW-24AT TaxID=2052957 RepID=UPI000C1E0220|nr:GNAT family N-acetyltransferase [Pseudorhodobacter sp. MZDSW-24AT]PJF07933.1 GNAT family N-acetyltransferase [Pseudorhodobacter sp. MZDSW-24AT]